MGRCVFHRSAVLAILVAAAGVQTMLAQAAAPAKPAIRTSLPKLRARFAAQSAPVGSPTPDVTCILYANTKDNRSHECKTPSGPASSDGPQSTQCGTDCTSSDTTSTDCSAESSTDGSSTDGGSTSSGTSDCVSAGTASCTTSYGGCYPASGPDQSGLTDPTTQNTDPDSYGDGNSPSSAAAFCQLEETGLQNSCVDMPAGPARSICQYEACQRGNSCVGAQKATCPKPPKGSATSLNDRCQSQYAANMSYCTTQVDAATQSTCMTTSLAELNGCTIASAAPVTPVKVTPRLTLPK
jgi:hypothetical protein